MHIYIIKSNFQEYNVGSPSLTNKSLQHLEEEHSEKDLYNLGPPERYSFVFEYIFFKIILFKKTTYKPKF